MDRADVMSGAAFKAALRGTILLAVILALSGWGAFSYLRTEMVEDLRAQIIEDRTTLEEIFRFGGRSGLATAMDDLRHPLPTKIRLLGLFDADGQRLAGNIAAVDGREGWFESAMPVTGTDVQAMRAQATRFLVNSVRLGDLTLVVGLNMTAVEAKEREMVVVFAVMGLVIGGAFLLIGYVASLRSMRKLQHMADVLDRVSQGDETARLEVSSDNDQIDRVARGMNQHLARLSALMATTRASAAAIAHDLRTPLSRAFLAVDRAQLMHGRGEDPVAALEDVEAELSRLRAIFDVILRISRLEQAQDAPPLTPVAVAPVLADLAETFAVLAEDRGQTLILDPVPGDLAVTGDGPMLSQLLANLLQNAINHCPAGTVIRMGARDHGRSVLIAVVDSGPGIPEAEREKVFDLFYSVDPTRTRGGNGLGLALVRAIGDRMGAKVRLGDAAPGLRVDVVLPRAAA
ncbi:MAG: HAMP domain-containing histidine kinase [Rhodobacteraceae bacterium]|jgi:signal transduction histidine kinase|nr:HAMP domain-containing histidine kinase [Paracoccaceae bacterium]